MRPKDVVLVATLVGFWEAPSSPPGKITRTVVEQVCVSLFRLNLPPTPPPRKLHTNYYLWGPKRWPSCTLMMSTMWNLVRRRGWSAVRVCTVSRFQLKTWIWNLEITLWFQVKSVKEWSPQIESTLYTSKDKLHTRVFFFVAWQPIPDISSGSSYIHLSLDCYNFFGRSRLVASLVLWRESRNSRWGHFMDLSKSGKTEELEFL